MLGREALGRWSRDEGGQDDTAQTIQRADGGPRRGQGIRGGEAQGRPGVPDRYRLAYAALVDEPAVPLGVVSGDEESRAGAHRGHVLVDRRCRRDSG